MESKRSSKQNDEEFSLKQLSNVLKTPNEKK